jgi:hypothetical protein
MQGVIGETVKPWSSEYGQNRGIFAYDLVTKPSSSIYRLRFLEKSAFFRRARRYKRPAPLNTSFTNAGGELGPIACSGPVPGLALTAPCL